MRPDPFVTVRTASLTCLWTVAGSASVTTMSRSRANTSVSCTRTNTEASIPAESAGLQLRGDLCVCRGSAHTPTRVSTLNSDIGDFAAIVAHLHVEAAQDGEQLEAEDAAVFTSFRRCRRRHTHAHTRLSDDHLTGAPVSRPRRRTCPGLDRALHLLLGFLVPGGRALRRHGVAQVADGGQQSVGVKEEVQRGELHLEEQQGTAEEHLS